MNVIVLKGRMTDDPTARTAGTDGTAVASFTLAVDKNYQKGTDKITYFHRCVAFGRDAENIQKFFRKGDEICITGELQDNNYTDREGKKHYEKQVRIERWDFCGSKSDRAERREAPAEDPYDGFMPTTGIEEELPFN